MNAKITVHQLPDGTLQATRDEIGYMESRVLEGGVLYIDTMHVDVQYRRQGIGTELVRATLEYVGLRRIRILRGWLASTNAQVLREGVAAGLSYPEAAAATPLGRSAIRLGFSEIDYDALTSEFTAERLSV